MIAESATNFDALETLGRRVIETFIEAGAELVAPSVIQPAGLFLDVVGEELRGRTYVFTDPDGLELCLRPDLTVPACRIYLERDPDARSVRRFCYAGPIFRYQPQDAPAANAREARQAGFEYFGAADAAAADADVVGVTIAALRAAGATDLDLRMGDLGLFHALLDGMAMPKRWRRRLAHQFWRADAFRAELDRLVEWPAASAQGIDPALLARLDPERPDEAEAHLADYLTAHAIELSGTRTLTDIATGLLEAAADTRAGPLGRDQARAIEAYIAVAGAPRQAASDIEAIARDARCDIAAALTGFRARLERLADAGVDVDRAHFSGNFGRRFEYYTGFVFDLVAPALGLRSPVAGGGRYDGLLEAVGAPRKVPAVGAAVHTERLRALSPGGTP